MALHVASCPKSALEFKGGDVATWRAITAYNLRLANNARRIESRILQLLNAGRLGIEAARLLAQAASGRAISRRAIARAIARALRPDSDVFQAISDAIWAVVAVVAQAIHPVAIMGYTGPPQARPAVPNAPNLNP